LTDKTGTEKNIKWDERLKGLNIERERERERT
jgi:hypothetical protein